MSRTVRVKSGNSKWKQRIPALIVVFVLVFSIFSFILVHMNFLYNFGKVTRPEHSIYPRFEDYPGFTGRGISFQSGKNTLTGDVFGAKNRKGLLVLSHGIGGGAEDYLSEIVYFVDHGWKVLAFDNTGSYRSDGKGTRGMAQSAIDLNAALDYVESDPDLKDLPLVLYGHSWGGYAVAAVLDGAHEISAAVSVAGYERPMSILMEQAKQMLGLFAYVEAPYIWIYNRILFGGNANRSAVNAINVSGTPILIIHGSGDEAIDPDGASIIAWRDRITNPRAEYMIREEAGVNGHNTLLLTSAAAVYQKEIQAEGQAIVEKYEGDPEKIPAKALDSYYNSIDRLRVSQLDPAAMDQIGAFLDRSIAPEQQED
jgi:pimeloyl-ACP methyl ester carboxylesterase